MKALSIAQHFAVWSAAGSYHKSSKSSYSFSSLSSFYVEFSKNSFPDVDSAFSASFFFGDKKSIVSHKFYPFANLQMVIKKCMALQETIIVKSTPVVSYVFSPNIV